MKEKAVRNFGDLFLDISFNSVFCTNSKAVEFSLIYSEHTCKASFWSFFDYISEFAMTNCKVLPLDVFSEQFLVHRITGSTTIWINRTSSVES